MPQVEEGQFSTEGSVHLDALRGSAALVVALGHTRSLYFGSTKTAPPGRQSLAAFSGLPRLAAEPRITIGNESVMIFFVLSGFLVGGSVLRSFDKEIWSWSDYLIKRLTRLWVVLVPALALGLLIDFAGIKLFGSQSIYGSPPGQLIVVGDVMARLRLPVLLGNLFFTQGILVPEFGVNESLWSLTFEFWYYLLFPLLMVVFLGRAKLLPRLFALGGFVAISYFVGLWIMLHLPLWALGALVAWLPLKLSEQAARRFAFGTVCLLLLAMPLTRKVPVSIYTAECCVSILVACLIYCVRHLSRKRRPDWYSEVSGFFSRISYTLYLIHLPLAVFACGLLNCPWHHWPPTATNLTLWFATNGAIVALAYGLYLLFESNTNKVRSAIMRAMTRQRVAVVG